MTIGLPDPSSIGNVNSAYFRSGIPMIEPPNGTMAAAGAFTLGTALALVYPNAFIDFPDNAFFAGSIGGMYFVQMSDTTHGTVFNNLYQRGAPASIPSPPTPFRFTTPGTWSAVPDTSTLSLLTLPPGLLGVNACLRLAVLFSFNNSVNNKRASVQFGGQYLLNNIQTTMQSIQCISEMYCRGVMNAQVIFPVGGPSGSGQSTSVAQQMGVDQKLSQDLVIGCELFNAADWVVLEGYSIEIFD